MKAPNPRRLELAKLSRAFKPLVQSGKFPNVNAAVMAYYQQQTGKQEWRTFRGWKEAGFSVIKGSSGFPIWATPRPMGSGKPAEDEPANLAEMGHGGQWFPVCYLFHEGQVIKAEARNTGFSDDVRAVLQGLKHECGHEERGGRIVVDVAGASHAPGMGDVIGRTPWIGHRWWFDRPDKLNASEARAAIDKALSGEKLGTRESRFIEYAVQEAMHRLESERMAA